jgi:hypothetical protein
MMSKDTRPVVENLQALGCVTAARRDSSKRGMQSRTMIILRHERGGWMACLIGGCASGCELRTYSRKRLVGVKRRGKASGG